MDRGGDGDAIGVDRDAHARTCVRACVRADGARLGSGAKRSDGARLGILAKRFWTARELVGENSNEGY